MGLVCASEGETKSVIENGEAHKLKSKEKKEEKRPTNCPMPVRKILSMILSTSNLLSSEETIVKYITKVCAV